MTSISKWRDKHPVSAILFFKIILAKTLQDGKLKLPNSFTRKYGNGLSKPVVFLKPPDGTEWEVCWTKHDDEIFLEKGWNEFAAYYTLDHGHLVLFEYKKETTCHFEVHIFDITGLEIDYPLNDEAVVGILDEMPPSQKNTRLKKSPMFSSSPQPCKKLRTGTSEYVGTSYTLQNLPQQLDQIHGEQSQGTNLENSTFASVKKELDEDISGVTQCPQAEQSTKGTESLNRARTFRSRNPSFMVVMKPSYVNSYSLNVPSNFAEIYLKKKQGATVFQVEDGRTWTITYSVGKLNAGWKRFASDNDLNVGDNCVFELTDRKRLSFKVSISRAVQEPSWPLSQEIVQGDGHGDGVKWLDPGRVKYVDSDDDITIINAGRKAAQRTSSMVIGTDSGTNEAMKEAEKFTSENPFFTVYIKQSYQETDRPRVPPDFMKKYLKNEKQMLTLRFGNEFWRVKLLCYSYRTASKLSNGWVKFARGTELQAGDVCIFELINREDAEFNVHIFRCNY